MLTFVSKVSIIDFKENHLEEACIELAKTHAALRMIFKFLEFLKIWFPWAIN